MPEHRVASRCEKTMMAPEAAEWGFHHLLLPIPALPSPCISPNKVCGGCALPFSIWGRSTLGPTQQDGGDFISVCGWFGVCFFFLTDFKCLPTSWNSLAWKSVRNRVLRIPPSLGVLEFPALPVWVEGPSRRTELCMPVGGTRACQSTGLLPDVRKQ